MSPVKRKNGFCHTSLLQPRNVYSNCGHIIWCARLLWMGPLWLLVRTESEVMTGHFVRSLSWDAEGLPEGIILKIGLLRLSVKRSLSKNCWKFLVRSNTERYPQKHWRIWAVGFELFGCPRFAGRKHTGWVTDQSAGLGENTENKTNTSPVLQALVIHSASKSW